MTPKELCDTAAEINVVVPNLVPNAELRKRSLSNSEDEFWWGVEIESPAYHDGARDGDTHLHYWVAPFLPDAAATMLGRTDAWLANNPNHPARSVIVPINVRLLTYVGTTLPGINV